MGKHYNPFDDMDLDDAPRGYDGDEPEGVDVMVDKVLQERETSIQVVLSDTGDIRWIPKSVIHSDSEVYEKPDEGPGGGKLVLHRWFAEQEKYI